MVVNPDPRRSASRLVPFGLGVLIGTLVCAMYADIMQRLALQWWSDPAASYGALIPPVALYFAWTRRRVTLTMPLLPTNWGLGLVLSACLILLVGRLGAEFYLARISFVVLVAGLAATFWGVARLRTLAFPLVLLATMVPLPTIVYNSLTTPLQLLASEAATSFSQGLGVTVHQDGNIIYLANITLGVAEACSGLQSLSALIITAVLLGYIHCRRLRTRFALVVVAGPIAVALNIMRVSVTAVLADYRPENAEGFYHFFSGWAIFVVGLCCLWWTAKGLVRLLG